MKDINKYKYNKFYNAVVEAERFIRKAKEAMDRLSNDKHLYASSKETAAAKRASMDLTRALVDVRK